MRVLLTGASGFIGRHCLPLLRDRGHEVHAVSSRPPCAAPGGARWHQADLRDPAQVAALLGKTEPTHVLHLAWCTAPGAYWESPENLRWVEGGLALLRGFAGGAGRRIVVAGSCAEYDWNHGMLCSERLTPCSPTTLYGICKHALHGMLSAFAERAGLSAAWARLFYLYGPHEHPARLVPSVLRTLLRGEPARCSSGTQRRDFLYVRDAADALVTLLESDLTGAVNIASGMPRAVRDVVLRAAEKLRSTALLQLGAVPQRSGEPDVLLADVRRLRDELGWVPRYDLDQGLDETIAWWGAAGERHG